MEQLHHFLSSPDLGGLAALVTILVTIIATIRTILSRILLPIFKRPKRQAVRIPQPAPAGYYRHRFLVISLFIALILPLAVSALFFSQQQGLFESLLFYGSITTLILDIGIAIPFSIYITIRKL